MHNGEDSSTASNANEQTLVTVGNLPAGGATEDVDMSDGRFSGFREEDISVGEIANDSPDQAVVPSTQSSTVPTRSAEETVTNGPSQAVVPSTQSLTVTRRFAEQQDTSDAAMIQNLMDVYTTQYNGNATPMTDVPTVTASNAPSTRDSTLHSAQGVMASMHSPMATPTNSSHPAPTVLTDRSVLSDMPTAHPPTQFQGPAADSHTRASQDMHSHMATSAEDLRSEQRNEGQIPSLTSNTPQHGASTDGRNSNSSITYADLQLVIRGISGLSTDIRETRDMIAARSMTGGRTRSRTQQDNARLDADVAMDSSFDIGDDADDEDDDGSDSRKKSTNDSRLHRAIRDRLNELHLRIDKDRQQLTLADPPSRQAVADYFARRHDGPSLNDLKIDWTNTLRSHWNSAAIHLLSTEIMNRVRNNYYTNPLINYENWMTSENMHKIIRAKLDLSRKVYLEALPPDPATNMSFDDKAAILKARKDKVLCENRRRMRKKSLYETRMRIVKENLGTDPVWESVLKVMKTVGSAAMSDDETDVERTTDSNKVVRRVDTPWASPALKAMINTIDLYYSRFNFDGNEKAGQNRRDRVMTVVTTSHKPAPKRLPGNCYNEYFLNNLNEYNREKLKVKRDVNIPTLPLPPNRR